MPKLKEPSIRQRKFVEAYLSSGKAKDSAIQAGYSPRSAGQIATRLLSNKDVEKLIELGGQIGMNTLVDVSMNGKVEIARVQASKELVERAYGKAKSNDDNKRVPSITINMNKIDITGATVESRALPIDVQAVADSSQGK